MTTETLPLFLKLFNVFWEQIKISIHRLSEYVSMSQPATEEVPYQTPRHTQWVLAEKTGTDKKRNVMMVEVEYFNDTYTTDLQSDAYHIHNYTIDGEDPNLRITHYPPSNRIH